MKTYDIKSDLPTVLEAGKRLADAIRDAKNQKLKVVKILHGYGSSGIGGSIRVAIRKSLRNKVSKTEIKAFIPGEAFATTMGFDEIIKTYEHLLKGDSDYKKMNDGITYVIL